MCAKVVILPDSANSFPFFLMSVKVEMGEIVSVPLAAPKVGCT